ncbi:mannitol dehydrogenase family protein [Streptomyces chiangmaiensis]|uniref:Mannitol dehydrogenase family protein n=1 Tax=Streptomyces chiangmaiensis TaxID=766497 RepID=A0ABU7FP47_9ACTN|nr:mannitol dehydrogenase family protein [Streptomyces chiangmaiensis]MED7825168.1 mannitol dehydrogenase family protein [Streptomyces chiangmaiensis]
MSTSLSRAAGDGRPQAPIRLLHLGLGNFFRAHQAWYTDRAPDANHWGIAAFTGRRPGLADALWAQDGLYTLVTRGARGDRNSVVSSLAAVHPGGDHEAWLSYWQRPELAVVTMTVTEAGYTSLPGGGLDVSRPDVQADIETLRKSPTGPASTAAGRLLAGLAARQAAGCPPLAIVPCDNLPGNGEVIRQAVHDLAEHTGLTELVDQQASFVTCMVDRITPATTDQDREAVGEATGRIDAAPVVTEPFSEWVLSGDFPAGRPRWEDVGARFVDDIIPYEQRKLWLLNGAHSLLAYAGSALGHTTVAEAVADPCCREWLDQWWSEASSHLPLPTRDLADYREALLGRFANPCIRHLLAQIAADGSQKLPVRVLPVLRLERARGAMPQGAIRILAAWIGHLRGAGAPVQDARAAEVVPLAQGPLPEAVRRLLGYLDPQLPFDSPLVAALTTAAESVTTP